MSDTPTQTPFPIPVVTGADGPVPTAAPPLSDEDSWLVLRRELLDAAAEGLWDEVFRRLRNISSKRSHPEFRKAFAQQVWVALKADISTAEVVETLKEWVIMLGPSHELSGAIAVLAYQIAGKRSEHTPDNGFSMVQAQQLLNLVCQAAGVEREEGFNQWVAANSLDDPDAYLPRIMEGLEMMVLGDWWFDRDALQLDLERYNNDKN